MKMWETYLNNKDAIENYTTTSATNAYEKTDADVALRWMWRKGNEPKAKETKGKETKRRNMIAKHYIVEKAYMVRLLGKDVSMGSLREEGRRQL